MLSLTIVFFFLFQERNLFNSIKVIVIIYKYNTEGKKTCRAYVLSLREKKKLTSHNL